MVVSMYFEIGGRQQTPVYRLSTLAAGHELEGPALLIDDISTIVVEPACQAHITSRGDVRIAVGKSSLNKNVLPPTLNPVLSQLVGPCRDRSPVENRGGRG